MKFMNYFDSNGSSVIPLKYLVIFIVFMLMLLVGIKAMAEAYPVKSIVSTNKNMLKINSDGSVTINFVATATAATVLIGYPSVTIVDTDEHKIAIKTDGTLNINTK